ncbi:MAG: LCP family protein [Firmicutes bacterium]|nr:LCP family protein [Bacillota bacterium]
MQTKRKPWKTILLLCLAFLVFWFSSVWVRIYERSPVPNGREPIGDITNILLLGVDQRADEPSRADTIIIMSINHITEEMALVSIPRDSRVPIPGHGLDKINHAMQFGGIALMKTTIEQLLGVPIHHYLYTNLIGFEEMINAIGGIDLVAEREIIGLDGRPIVQAGPQHLNGQQALTYARFRSDAEGDFGRMRRQQQVIKAIIKRIRQMESIPRFPLLLEQLGRHLRTDMSIAALLDFARTGMELDFSKIPAVQLQGTVSTIDGISYVLLDQAFLLETVQRYLRWERETFSRYRSAWLHIQ